MSSTESDVSPQANVDGRRQRTQITRKNIIDAAIALQNDGNMRPSMQQISDRAGVSLRTAFQHFPEKHQLTRAVLDELTRSSRVDPPSPELAQHSALEPRIKRFLDIRARQLEALTPHRRASNAMIATWPMLQKHRLKVRKRYRDHVESWFAAELDQLPPASRAKWLTAIATLADWEMWQSLRTYPTRSVAESKAALGLLLTAALKSMDEDTKPA
jgi:TetR/AcrR family transcriptional regulator, regulator of autoinduction and epiphytic fitness